MIIQSYIFKECKVNEILDILAKGIKTSNPMFTLQSLRRTIEIIILRVNNRGFMETVSVEEINEVINSIPEDWNINDRISDRIKD